MVVRVKMNRSFLERSAWSMQHRAARRWAGSRNRKAKAIHCLVVLFIAFAASVLAGAKSEAQTTTSADAVEPVLHPGDVVRITVWRKPELSGEFPVAMDGSIADPFYMDVKVMDMPVSAASERVRAHLARWENEPRVLVEPLFRVSIGGEVRQPDLYSLRPETTIAQAVMQAGGYTERGRISRVQLWRNGQELTVDLRRPDVGLANMPVRSGDQILVPRSTSIVRDVIGPTSSIIGAVVGITNFILRTF